MTSSGDQNDRNEREGTGNPPIKPSGAFCHDSVKLLSNVDDIIRRLNKLLSTSSGRGTFIASIGHGSHALHYLLASSPSIAIRSRLRLLLLFTSPKAVVAPKPTTKPPLLAFASLVSETRYSLRLLDLIPLWAWASSVLKTPPQDSVLHLVALAQITSCVLYQALENIAFLASKGITGKKLVARTGGIPKWYLWSIRAWLCHVLLEFVRLYREVIISKRKAHIAGSEEKPQHTEDETQARLVAQQQQIRAWKKSLVNNIAWAPLCIHWSLPNGIGIPESLTGFISLIANIWGLYDNWNATATS